MNKQLGFILKFTKKQVKVLIPIHFFPFKYKKLQIKLKKYNIKDYREEFKKGDIILFNCSTNSICNFYK